MAHREFRDSQGVAWEVWDVVPGSITGTPLMPPRDDMPDGWLVFRCAAGKRRLFQRPEGWERYTGEQLAFLCRAAVPAPPDTA